MPGPRLRLGHGEGQQVLTHKIGRSVTNGWGRLPEGEMIGARVQKKTKNVLLFRGPQKKGEEEKLLSGLFPRKKRGSPDMASAKRQKETAFHSR